MTDQDHDGCHIKGLIINMFHSLWPSLLKTTFLFEFITPIAKAKHKTEGVKTFYSNPLYQEWNMSLGDKAKEWSINYNKGVGTCKSKDGKDWFSNLGMYTKKFVWSGEEDGKSLQLVFGKEKACTEERKQWIKNFPTTHLDRTRPYVLYKELVNYELIYFCRANLLRCIPLLVDGLKPSQRKTMFALFKSQSTEVFTVEQLAANVAQVSAYRHSLWSLALTITGMAQDYLGSNNVNLLKPNGQFGTRDLSGQDASNPKYNHTKISSITRFFFPENDDVHLKHLFEDQKTLEPKSYVPVIPTVLVNGAKGAGSGWSTDIPNYDPRVILSNVRHHIKGEVMETMIPWYRHFKGTIVKANSRENRKMEPHGGPFSYRITGLYEMTTDSSFVITELPVYRSTQSYLIFLKGLKEKRVIQDYKNDSDLTSIKIEVFLTEDDKMDSVILNLEKIFKLSKYISTRNMHLLREDGCIEKYNNPEEIIKDFCAIRLGCYEKRRKAMLENLKAEVENLNDKVECIREESQNKVNELVAERDERMKELISLESSTAKSLWLKDLDSLEIELEKFYSEDGIVGSSRKGKKQLENVTQVGESPPKKKFKSISSSSNEIPEALNDEGLQNIDSSSNPLH